MTEEVGTGTGGAEGIGCGLSIPLAKRCETVLASLVLTENLNLLKSTGYRNG